MTRLDVDMVRCLVREQFPQWGDQPVMAVEPGGWDNRTFRIGAELSARLPSAEAYVAAVDKEHTWLPRLAPHLHLRIPEPVARGEPGCGFPRPWSIYHWLPGSPARRDLCEPLGCARELASFLTELQSVPAGGGPVAGAHSFGRGGPLAAYDRQTRETVQLVRDRIDPSDALRVWEAALAEPHRGEPQWVHGDLTPSNLLVEHGRLIAVIDFGTCAVGDPACDLAVAWTFFDGSSRQVFREALCADDACWARARGWALWKALLTLAEPDGGRDAVARYGWRCSARDLVTDLIVDLKRGS